MTSTQARGFSFDLLLRRSRLPDGELWSLIQVHAERRRWTLRLVFDMDGVRFAGGERWRVKPKCILRRATRGLLIEPKRPASRRRHR